MSADRDHVRIAEAMLFAAEEPLTPDVIARRLPADTDIDAVLAALAEDYRGRGVEAVQVNGKWLFRTAPDLADALIDYRTTPRRLSRAAVETLAIIAYHQPITRAEIEELRGVSLSKGTMDVLMETLWVRPRGRRQTPGRPVVYGTTDAFLVHFGLSDLKDLPGVDELKATGLLSAEPAGFGLFADLPEEADDAADMAADDGPEAYDEAD